LRAHNGPVPLPLHVPLASPVDLSGFHAEATRLLAQQVPPDLVQWAATVSQSPGELDCGDGPRSLRNRAARALVPQSFVRLSELVVLHRDPLRFDLLYRTLWRLVHEPELRRDPGDSDLQRLRQMAQSVRRDVQKMKTRLVFRPLVVHGQVVAFAWYEPVHFIGESVAAMLVKAKMATPWMICTPDRCLRSDGEHHRCAPTVPSAGRPAIDAGDMAWARALEALTWA
jgi:probable DNA metabolism protein